MNHIHTFAALVLSLLSVTCAQRGAGNCNDYADLPRGKVKVRNKGRIAKFSCSRDSILIGSEIATCIRREWLHNNGVPPVCIRKGCLSPANPPNGFLQLDYGGALVRFRCNPGYRLLKESLGTLFCDGMDWNGTTPICQAIAAPKDVPTSCDFEEDFCLWQQDQGHDVDWERQKLATPSRSVGTGPSFDHTFGEMGTGYYIYAEASGARSTNDSARLYSPVYKPDLTQNGTCFIFWYHMFGGSMGTLNVYLRPESKQFVKLMPSFQKTGNQGDQWSQGFVSIGQLNENFQIIIEALRGASYVSDIAIDDVRFGRNEDCLEPTTTTESITKQQTISPFLSCNGKCGMTPITPEGNSCSCGPTCLSEGNCCLDFTTYCLANRTTEPAMTSTVERLPSANVETTTPPAMASSLASVLPGTSTITVSSTIPAAKTASPEISTAVVPTDTTTISRTTDAPNNTNSTDLTTTSVNTVENLFTTELSESTTSITTSKNENDIPTIVKNNDATTLIASSTATSVTLTDPSPPSTSSTSSSPATTVTLSTTAVPSTTVTVATTEYAEITTSKTTYRSTTITNAPAVTVQTTSKRVQILTSPAITVTKFSRNSNTPKFSEVPETRTTSVASTAKITDSETAFPSSETSSILITTTDHSRFIAMDSIQTKPNRIFSQSGLHDTIETATLSGSNAIILTSILGLTGCVAAAIIVTVLRRKRVNEQRQDRLPDDSDVRYLHGEEEIQLDLSEQDKNKRKSMVFGFEKF